MAARKRQEEPKTLVRRSILVDAGKLEKVRKALGLASDAAVLRLALDHLLEHFDGRDEEE
jgi:hypothetical protein